MTNSEKWELLSSELAINHPYVRVTMDTVRLPDGRVIEEWPTVHCRDYVNIVVINTNGEALILEGYKHGVGRNTWQVVGGYLEEDEDPFSAAQRELLEETGLECAHWRHLSSFVIDANRHVGTAHFFLGYGTKQVAEIASGDLEAYTLRWVSPRELKRALWDGRIGVIGYGVNIALALLALDSLLP